jgi:FKBP-type peptidyl-prolyl cis-trans isomerase FklB
MKRPLPALFFCVLAAPALAAAPTTAAIDAFLADNAKKPGVTVQPDGLQYSVLRRGMGRRPAATDYAKIDFTARLVDGTLVDGTSPGLPATVAVASAIPGLGAALQMMHEGDRWHLVLPAMLAFGAKGAANGAVPPGQALVIEVTLVAAETPARYQAETAGSGFSVQGNGRQQSLLFTFHP